MANKVNWLNDIEKFVLEEDKIVTYKWLSKKLNIHVNISKQLLYTFASQHESEKLGICYLVGGMMPDGSYRIVIGKKEDIPKVKNDFKRITSEHLYSVQKNATDADLNVILSTNVTTEENIENCTKCSSIECSESLVRKNSDIQDLKIRALLASKAKVTASVKQSIPETKKQIQSEKENVPEAVLNKEISKPEKETNTNKKAGGIAAMFAAQKDMKKPENKQKPQPQSKSKPKGGLSAFLSSGTKKTESVTNSKKDEKVSSAKEGNSTSHAEPNSANKDEEEVNEPVEKESLKDTKTSKNDDKKGKNKSKTQNKRKRKNSKDNEADTKKRKRILVWSDSESSGEEQEEDERMDDSPCREPTPPPPPASDEEDTIPATPEVGKRAKKKKLIEKTFLDADGFLVTNKEYVFVSDSEDEEQSKKEESTEQVNGKTEVVQSKPKPTSPSKSKRNSPSKSKPKSPSKAKKRSPTSKKQSPQKAKQASIMSFFTKK